MKPWVQDRRRDETPRRPRTPCPGKSGVIEEGTLADILLINGDPLEDILILTKPEENLALIMKDGTIYRNTIK
jgi:imidazolonepropionase-like amidohydrolase